MRYVKPSVANLGVASAAIQGNAVKGGMHSDADHNQSRPSTGTAYDLDE